MLKAQGKPYGANKIVEKNMSSIQASGYPALNCVGRTVVPSMVPNISRIVMTPQLINNIRNDVCDQIHCIQDHLLIASLRIHCMLELCMTQELMLPA